MITVLKSPTRCWYWRKGVNTLNWYVPMYDSDTESSYWQYDSDEQAVNEILDNALWADETVLEIYRCNDDETLSPAELIYH